MFHQARQSFMMRGSANVSRSTSQRCASTTPTTVSAPRSSYPMNNIGYSRFNQVRWHSSAADTPLPPTGKSGLLHRYNMWSQRSPIICITVTSSTLWCLGDLSAQYIEGGTSNPVAKSTEERDQMIASSSTGLQRFLPPSLRYLWSKDWFTIEIGATDSASGFCIDARRLVTTTVFGSLIAGVGGHFWYKYLDHLVLNVIKLENRGTHFVITKWLIECTFWHPVTLFTFWVFVGLTGGGDNLDQIKRQLQSDFLGTLAAELCLYTPVDLLNFSKVPLHLQVVVCNVASFFEAIMLSYLHNLSAENEKNGGKH